MSAVVSIILYLIASFFAAGFGAVPSTKPQHAVVLLLLWLVIFCLAAGLQVFA